MFNRNSTTSTNFFKSKSEDKKDVMIYFRNRKNYISLNVNKYKSEISTCLNEYKKKSDFNNSIFEKFKNNYKNFERINSLIKDDQKSKEQKLIFGLAHKYYTKKNMNFTQSDLKANIFENSALIEPSLFRLKMDYLLNYKRIKKEINENQKRNKNMKIFSKTINVFKNDNDSEETIKKDITSNNFFYGNKIGNQINCLNDVKFMKKMDIISKSKMMNSDLYRRKINKNLIKHKLEEMDKNATIEEMYNTHTNIKNLLNDIQIFKKNFKSLENEGSQKSLTNLFEKKKEKEKSKSLFYIPTIVKSFPELLYDKINSKKKLSTKIDEIFDSSPSSLTRTHDKSSSLRLKSKDNIYEYKDLKSKKISKIKSDNVLNKFKEILKEKKMKLSELGSHIFKKMMTSQSALNIKDQNSNLDETTKMYNDIVNMSTEEKNSNKNRILMREFLNEKNKILLDYINENKPKNYFNSLKKIHKQFHNDNKRKQLYNSFSLLRDAKTKNTFKEMKNFQKALRNNENLLIKVLIDNSGD